MLSAPISKEGIIFVGRIFVFISIYFLSFFVGLEEEAKRTSFEFKSVDANLLAPNFPQSFLISSEDQQQEVKRSQ